MDADLGEVHVVDVGSHEKEPSRALMASSSCERSEGQGRSEGRTSAQKGGRGRKGAQAETVGRARLHRFPAAPTDRRDEAAMDAYPAA